MFILKAIIKTINNCYFASVQFKLSIVTADKDCQLLSLDFVPFTLRACSHEFSSKFDRCAGMGVHGPGCTSFVSDPMHHCIPVIHSCAGESVQLMHSPFTCYGPPAGSSAVWF